MIRNTEALKPNGTKAGVGVDAHDNSSDCYEDLAKTEAVLIAAQNKQHVGEIIIDEI